MLEMMIIDRAGRPHHENGDFAPIHPDWIVETARALHDEGWGAKRIARKLEISVNTVKWWLAYRGRR